MGWRGEFIISDSFFFDSGGVWLVMGGRMRLMVGGGVDTWD